MRWNESVTLCFVKLYLKHECLWNPDHPAYKLKPERNIAYKSIGIQFRESTGIELCVNDTKVKIKNLRTTYLQQVRKVLEKSRPGYVYEPSLIWFQEMDKCLNKIPIGSHSRQSAQPSDQNEVDSSEMWLEEEQTTDENPDPLLEESLSVEYEDTIKQEPTIRNSKKVKRRKLKQHKHESLAPDSNTSSELMNANEDEFDIYGKFIASQLRKMNLRKALKLQLEIQSLISNARMADL